MKSTIARTLAAALFAFCALAPAATGDGDEKKPEKEKTGVTEFYGVKVASKRFIFVIDCSASMLRSSSGGLGFGGGFGGMGGGGFGGGGAGSPPKLKESEDSRLALAKKELIKVIEAQKEETVFNIVIFHQKVTTWKSEMVRATAENRSEAVKYVEEIAVGGGTFLYDALEQAFRMQINAKDAQDLGIKAQTVKTSDGKTSVGAFADAVYLLSDGKPSGGKFTKTDDIRREIKEMNKQLKIKINAVAIGEEDPLMKALAADTKGEFRVAK